MPDPYGCAVVMKCDNITKLEEHICALSEKLNVTVFELVSVELIKSGSEPGQHLPVGPCPRDIMKQANAIIAAQKQAQREKWRQSKKQKQAEDTESEIQARREKARQGKKRKRAEDTESEIQTRR